MKTIELVLQPEEAANEKIISASIKYQQKLLPADTIFFTILKRSIDARSKKVKIRLSVTYEINKKLPEKNYEIRQLQNIKHAQPVIIIGCGPAGMFAALRLIELGFKPIIIERGKTVKDRRRDLATINRKGIINPDSNYCFGEGGAGTYSDGKLYTRSSKRGSVQKILETFIQFGANPDIAIDAHPHIGTNKLPQIIENIRNSILDCGGEILFNMRFSSFILAGKTIKGVNVKAVASDTNLPLACKAVILATGHSARDIFHYFNNNNFKIEAKPFALGVRIEHPQQIIDSFQYHCNIRSEFLPPASYSLVHQDSGKGVYSFCMCPGGIIAPAATAPGELVVNGWSPSKRNNPYANSGIVVSINEKDFIKYSSCKELAAMKYQQEVERKAFEAGGSNLQAPAQRMVDFVNRKNSSSLPACSYIPGITPTNLYEVLPKEVTHVLQHGLRAFGQKMKGYLTNEAVLVATESRTSSPVRIPRDSITLMHPELHGLFPCGEGAGYAGGIVSAAIDGERCAEAVVKYN